VRPSLRRGRKLNPAALYQGQTPFIIANLEDLEGNIEVTVWSEVYEQTKETLEEGEILLVEGKVRVRDDRNDQLPKVRQYQSGVEIETKTPEIKPAARHLHIIKLSSP